MDTQKASAVSMLPNISFCDPFDRNHAPRCIRLKCDMMSALYISEGTFKRARRWVVQGLIRAMAEMERETKRSGIVAPQGDRPSD